MMAGLPVVSNAEAPAAPSAEKIALVKRYFAAVHFDTMMSNMMKQMGPAMMEQMRKSQPGINETQVKAVTEAMTESMDIYMPKMIDAMIPVYADTFSVEELTKMDEFYESPVGQSITAKIPVATQKMLPTIMPIIPEMQADMMKRLCSKMACPTQKSDKPAA